MRMDGALIVDMETGLQYLGTAYGKDGILGRWKKYSNNVMVEIRC